MTDINYSTADVTPPITKSVPLGIQHVLAMFASNVTPAIIIASVAGLAGADKVYMIQMAMVFAGIATLLQTIGFGPVGARLPIMQGTSFAFVPIMIPIAKTAGIGAVFGATVIGGIFHLLLGTVIGRIRNLLPPLVTGLVILTIGLALIPVGIKYAAGGVPLMGKEAFGSFQHWGLALVVIIVTLAIKFYVRGFASTAAVLLGLIAGYIVAAVFGMVDFGRVAGAAWFALPQPLKFGFDVNAAAVIGMCLMAIVSAIETVGDISGITKGGAGREATDREISGGTMADGLGTAVAGLFGGLPNTSFSQNVGLIAMTGVMSRHVVTIGAVFLVIAGVIPKVGAVIAAMPIAVLGGGVIMMFGMVASAGLNMLADVQMTRRNMMILALSLSLGLGLQSVPGALQHLPETLEMLLKTGLLPVAIIAIVLNAITPENDS
ncbi:MAG: uracil permease [Proteobacteria bacterium]|nr:uracil permease [Pseudomonadota bacterium]MDP6392315.1 nucleobase:cation symporter-2 family protein [Arenicellales bacterium]MDP7220330.1 nucleobase:cation symporter-2 family protein [Arenicellales bacterium]HJP11888.1 nucleobase:cation symporter-2 family protein [Arenicellales bacterium]